MKALLLYYSYGGNTRRVAEKIARETGADLCEIRTVHPYEGDYQAVVDQGQEEIRRGFEPELLPLEKDPADYEVVILGTPVWWYTFAPAMRTLLHRADWTGKRVYPFATNGGWIGHTFADFRKFCPGAQVEDGLNLRFDEDRLQTPEEKISVWSRGIH